MIDNKQATVREWKPLARVHDIIKEPHCTPRNLNEAEFVQNAGHDDDLRGQSATDYRRTEPLALGQVTIRPRLWASTARLRPLRRRWRQFREVANALARRPPNRI